MENVKYKIRSVLYTQSLVWGINTNCKEILNYGKGIRLYLMAMLTTCSSAFALCL